MTPPKESFFRPAIFLSVLAISLLPRVAGAADLRIYADALDSGWDNWSWSSTLDFAATAPVKSGTHSLSVKFDSGWAGLYLHANAVDTSEYASLSFWINGGATGGQQLRVVANGDDSAAYSVSAQKNTWTQVTIPLSALGSPASLSALYWQDTTGGAQPVYYLDDITLIAGPPQPPPSLSIDAGAGRHSISNDIYGMNYADEQLAAELRLPVRRWGGNSTSRYNWKANIYNTGSDWYFENIPSGAAVQDGSASDLFIDQDRRTGTRTLMTVPLIGWVSKAASPRDHPYDCGFKVSRYGSQQSVDPWDTDCGNGVNGSGVTITGNSAADTSSAIDATFVRDWINHLTARYGTAANGGVAYYNLDNEPMLWNSTHRDVHPQATTYNEMRDRTYQYAAAVKSADPTAKTLGPVLWGWCAYFYSALDGCQVGTDYQTHGSTYFVPWYLQQMKSYEQQNGVRILDYLDLHSYPQADGVSLSPAGDAATQALRLRSTRSLWDPAYTDESWIADSVRLIPRMRDWVNTNYPGTKLAITEYNWGGLESINGALAQADVLGIFGREGLDLATLWGPPDAAQPGAFAFRIYRNYDGAGHGFGDTSVQSASSNQGKLAVYAAQRTSDGALTIIVINKTGGDLLTTVNLAGIAPQPTAAVYRYSPAKLDAIVQAASQPVTASGFSALFPANSITLFVIMPDITPPDTAITSTPPALTNEASASFGLSSTKTGSTFECSLDGGTFAVCANPATYSFVSVGTHTFRARAVDQAGNRDATPAGYTWERGVGLTLGFSGNGGGTVTSSPAGLSCTAFCLYVVTPGNLTLTGTPDIYSYFAGWSGGGCDGVGTCVLPMLADTGVTATFSTHPPLVITGGSPTYFAKLADAYAAVSSNGTIIQARVADLQENIDLSRDIGFMFQGGYDGTFTAVSGYTSLTGTLTIGKGSIVLANMVIK